MSNRDLKRVQDDLATVKSALGWDLPFNKQDAVLSAAIGTGGLLCMVWMMQPYPLTGPWQFMVAWAFMVLPPLLCLVYASTKGLEFGLRSCRRWDFQRATLGSVVLVYIFFLWAIASDLVSVEFGASAMVFIFGSVLLSSAAGSRSYRSNMGWGVGFMLFAVLQLISDIPFMLLFGIQFMIGGFVSSVIMVWQLRTVERIQRAH